MRHASVLQDSSSCTTCTAYARSNTQAAMHAHLEGGPEVAQCQDEAQAIGPSRIHDEVQGLQVVYEMWGNMEKAEVCYRHG